MTDPAPPRKPGGRKWILWGCGCGSLVIVTFAAVFGYLIWRIQQETAGMAELGAQYLRLHPDVQAELGTVQAVDSKPGSSSVSLSDEYGEARFGYTVRGARGEAEAEVMLAKHKGGDWHATRAKLVIGARIVPIGASPPPPARKD